MGRIFISAGHGGFVGGTPAQGQTTEAAEMIALRDVLMAELRSRDRSNDFELLAVPDELTLEQTLNWVNSRAQGQDVAIEIRASGDRNPALNGAAAYYIANNDDRRAHAELILLAVLRRVPRLPSRGARPDTETSLGALPFCRQIKIPSLHLQLGNLAHREDRELIQNRRRDLALGLADGISSWARLVASTAPQPTPTLIYPTIQINLNGGIYEEPGVIVNGNAYIPIDLVDRLGLPAQALAQMNRIRYQHVVYTQAIELRNHNIAVTWEPDIRTVMLRTVLPICPGDLDLIMGKGKTSDVQLMMFLKAYNEKALGQFPELPKYYREEAAIEGVNHDIAFSQMCLETGFLTFGGDVKPEQNNFAGLGAIGGGTEGARFNSPRLGVRAHVQHLKAYASREPLVQELVDPRFRFVNRGSAPLVDQLSGRWAADLSYGSKILAILKRLYESVGLM